MIDTRSGEACLDLPWPGWDTIWDPATQSADWGLAGSAEGNAGGLAASAALDTAVILCLFTDRRCPAGHPLARFVEDGDPRGWWGDGIDLRRDLGEAPLGSLLWLLERAAMLPEIEIWAKALIEEALAPLVARRVVVSIAVKVAARAGGHGLDWSVALYGRDGSLVYDRKFAFAWNQITP